MRIAVFQGEWLALLALTAWSCGTAPAPHAESASMTGPVSVRQYGVFELTARHDGKHENPFFDATLNASFTAPSGRKLDVPGFYYAGNEWKVRFRPAEAGVWKYAARFSTDSGFHTSGGGTFRAAPASDGGPVRPAPGNRFRWVTAGGRPYFPLGVQDCATVDGRQPAAVPIDGEKRGDTPRMVSRAEYFSLYGAAGFNLFRFSQRNCSYSLYDDLDHYRVDESLATDELLRLAQENGFRVMYGIFGTHANWHTGPRTWRGLKRLLLPSEEALDDPDDRDTMAKEQRFIRYSVARWGAYTDIWELLNERDASDRWVETMAEYLHKIDPERKPVATSWERPALAAIDVNAPHWYEGESELASDIRVKEMAAQWKRFGKPVVVGEQGNTGMNWDAHSALRMRIRAWTALFEEIALVFWNTSWSKAGVFEGHPNPKGAANIYLGPEERSFTAVLGRFASRLPRGLRKISPELAGAAGVRAYGLASPQAIAVYLHHGASHEGTAAGVKVALGTVATGEAEWIDPASGHVLAQVRLESTERWIEAPPFLVDAALLVNLSR